MIGKVILPGCGVTPAEMARHEKYMRLAIAQASGAQMARVVADVVLVDGDFASVPRLKEIAEAAVASGKAMLTAPIGPNMSIGIARDGVLLLLLLQIVLLLRCCLMRILRILRSVQRSVVLVCFCQTI